MRQLRVGAYLCWQRKRVSDAELLACARFYHGPRGLGAANLASLVCLVPAVCDSQDQHRGVQVMCSNRLLMVRM